MSKVKGRNTKPEIFVRKLLFSMGYRFRLYDKKLSGKPDIVLPKYKTVIFVHGCFWHSHKNCHRGKLPSSNTDFWQSKLIKNRERDIKNLSALEKQGWNTLVIWTCEVKHSELLKERFKGIKGHGTTKTTE